jgi:PAS domain S-box-containing protein
MLGVTSDITDHIVTRNRLIDSEHQLRRSMDELEQLYVRAPLGLGLLDRELRFVRINDALAEMNGFPAAEHIGKAVWDLLPDLRSSAEPALRQVVATGKILRDFEISGVTAARPGEVRHWREQFYPLRGDDGTVLGIGIICEEVTERKRQDQALRDSEGHLRTLNEQLEKRVEEEIGRREAALAALHQSQKLDALGQLTAGIAHDFNNLVAAMAGGFSLVQRWTRNDERVQEVARQGLIAAGRGADLVKHLLAFARKQHLAPRRVNLADLLEEAEPLLRQSTGSRISVRIACPEVCPDVEVDVAQLETALMNLAINARDAMPDGGVLDITVAEPEPGIAAIVVRDRGGGMPADVLDRAREPFFTTKQPGKGTGLGLAMVHGFAEQSGGSLRITSEPGEGTTVELRLPSSGPAEAALAPATAEAARDSAAIRSILLVDDDDLVRTMTCRQLQELGYEVLAVPGAKAALAALDSGRRFDLMLCDVVMPGEDGPSLVARVRGRPAAPRVIFMTGHADRRRLTGERVLEKPFSLDQLIEAIGTA